jgi:hypothetical protein
LVEHDEKSANHEKVVIMSQNYDLVDACSENNYLKANLDGSHLMFLFINICTII